MYYLYASTDLGCEKLLEKELIFLGAKNLNVTQGGVYYEAKELLLYKSLIWSRIALKIFLCIKQFIIRNDNDLYINTYQINWDKILYLNKTFLVKFKKNSNISQNNLYQSLIIKDAIMNQFYKKYFNYPNIDIVDPDITIQVILINNTIDIMLDLSGDPLSERAYHKFFHIKSIRANISVAIVLNSSWKKNYPLIDPMYGAGILLIEAAMIYTERAPGLKREKWDFQSWKGYNKVFWDIVVYEANKRFTIKIKTCKKHLFIGYENNNQLIEQAKENAFNENVLDIIDFSMCNLKYLNNPYNQQEVGTLLSNPIYQKKYNSENTLVALYIKMGFVFKNKFKNWKLSICTTSTFLLSFLQMESYEEFFFKNKSSNYILKNYQIPPETFNEENKEYNNRLKKNIKKLKKWNDLKQIECFRIYDQDTPNYNIIVDIYKKWLVIQEYKAAKQSRHIMLIKDYVMQFITLEKYYLFRLII